MKIIFFGTPEIALKTLQALYEAKNIEIAAVVTQPDKPVGRKKILTAPPIKDLAEKLNIKVLQPENSQELSEKVQKFSGIDFFVVFAYGMIFPKTLLSLPQHGAINIHTSLLPKYRGASPIQEAILHGDSQTGISIMRMDEKMDHGDICLLKRVGIEEKDNHITLSEKLAEISAKIIVHALNDIMHKFLTPIRQEHEKASYCKKIDKEDGKIDFKKTAKEILNMIRAYTPWPETFTIIKNKKLKIISAEIDEKTSLQPGEFKIENNILQIGTKKGILIPKIVQLEGKKEMDIRTFLNGYRKLFEG